MANGGFTAADGLAPAAGTDDGAGGAPGAGTTNRRRKGLERRMAETTDIRTAERKNLPLGAYPRFVTPDFEVPGIDRIEVYRRMAATRRSKKR